MSSEIAIKVENLSKCYQIYDTPRDRLKQFIYPKIKSALEPVKKLITGHQSPITNYYHEFWALKDVSFEVKKGETVGIIGRNGSGKSTLLQMICGTLTPTSGSVQTNGRIAALLELGSGFNPEFTGRENVYMNASILGLSQDEIDARFDDIAAFADIGYFIEQPAKTYSSGMYVRLAFAVAISVEPEILIVDEALSVGDIRFQTKCINAISNIKENGSTILFVSHSAGQIEALCDRAIWLNDGMVKADGQPKSLMRNYINFMVHGIDENCDVSNIAASDAIHLNSKNRIADQWVEMTPHNNIKGDLSAVISKIMVFDIEGKAINILYAESQKINIKLVVETKFLIRNPLVAVGIFNILAEPIIHFNTVNTHSNIEQLMSNSNYIFDICFDLPALRMGDYLVSVGIDDGIDGASKVVCHIYDAWLFTVVAKKEKKPQAGYIQLENTKDVIKYIRGI